MTTGQTSAGGRLTRSVRLALCVRGSSDPTAAIAATSTTSPATTNAIHFMTDLQRNSESMTRSTDR